MNEDKELLRHERILKQINEATTQDELPKISFSTISSFLANNAYFENRKISQSLFMPVVDAIISYGIIAHPNVKDAFFKVIRENYPNVSEDDISKKYYDVFTCKRIGYILSEISNRNLKLYELNRSINLEEHLRIVKEIKDAYEIKDLPKVGLSELNKKLVKAVNDNSFVTNIKTSEIKELTDAYLNNFTYLEIEDIIIKIVDKYELSNEDKELMKEQILGALTVDETIEYTIEEIALKEKRKLDIYKINHEETMDAIKDAHRISQLPPNLTVSILTSYLNGNTTIYKNDDRIKAEDLKHLTNLLLDGYRWEDNVVINEIENIVIYRYPENVNEAFNLLYKKLSSLPRTYYLVEEINYSLQRQTEFIGRGSSNVNVYFIPNNKSPLDGGRFYNCYINRVNNLDLSEILPLDLDSIVPPEMDIDSIEWYVQQHADETFKTAGGIILNRDETIGNVSVFRPNDGKIGVTKEEKAKMDEIDSLDAQIDEKKKTLAILDEELSRKEQEASAVSNKINELITDYERKALELQMQLLSNIAELKKSVTSEEKGSSRTRKDNKDE